ncbi:MAG: 8-oxo-dGTP diphosphatase [Planctomycetota bacterium]|jgi:8-oxo-dGTP diphosphatase
MREQIRSDIAAIRPFDELERDHIEDALAWVDSGAALCRTQRPAYATLCT